MGFAGWHGEVKTLGIKGIKMATSALKSLGWDLIYRFTHRGRGHTSLPVGELLRTQMS